MKILKIIKKIASYILTFLALMFVLVVFLQRFSDNKLSFFNFRMFTVVTESMAPRYVKGDVLLARHIEPSKIKVGDDISYLGKYGDTKDRIITHEVTRIKQDENGKYIFRAKGLKNLIEDPTIHEDQLFGKIIYKSIIITMLYKAIETKLGMFLLIIVPLMGIITYEAFTIMLEREERKIQSQNN